MIITLIGMNGIAIAGIVAPTKGAALSSTQVAPPTLPTITISTDPAEIPTGSFAAIKWSVEGDVDSCHGDGAWSGPKTPYGAESSGRIASEGVKEYVLVCKNKAGEVRQSAKVTVKKGIIAAAPTQSGSTPSSSSAPVYCSGVSPCYGPREVAAHSSPGNCWGYNGNRVLNISGFDAAFHQSRSGISTIEVGGVCGGNLASALGGGVSADGRSQNHNNTTKANADRNMVSYFIGYFDAGKP